MNSGLPRRVKADKNGIKSVSEVGASGASEDLQLNS
jgi:hypothetical protein